MTDQEKIKIHTEGTPNPNALKFVVEMTLLEKGTYNFTSKENATNSPLALKLFEINLVKEVFIGRNFITVSKSQEAKWDNIYDKVLDTLHKHFNSGKPLVLHQVEESSKFKQETRNEVEQRILDILDNQIRPAVATDGGDIIFDSYDDGILRLHLQGSCSHCPSSIATLKAGIENLLKREIPELKEVISV